MKKQQIIYWSATGLFCLWMIANAYAYLTSAQAQALCTHFGFPGYFRIELAIAKIAGVIALLLPIIPARLKEWAYTGFTITVISGFIAHLCSGDSLPASLSALVALAILFTSYYQYHHFKSI
ncbi:DoxX-like family protein [Filimonas lacunae]|uniref:DoxX-like family protein n=1 Tax=Filimonas lacunae TaxID=477680 RepID=A0A173MBR7_9BACT|nr:DoxX family protein [Filimonas lacunae]BAV04995.1 hypothetical protein FLA_1000 [Filimonas lacunae]SIT33683.1 DoxX-like family protein [Filimonas lacunae]